MFALAFQGLSSYQVKLTLLGIIIKKVSQQEITMNVWHTVWMIVPRLVVRTVVHSVVMTCAEEKFDSTWRWHCLVLICLGSDVLVHCEDLLCVCVDVFMQCACEVLYRGPCVGHYSWCHICCANIRVVLLAVCQILVTLSYVLSALVFQDTSIMTLQLVCLIVYLRSLYKCLIRRKIGSIEWQLPLLCRGKGLTFNNELFEGKTTAC